jgi:hypothetical protein
MSKGWFMSLCLIAFVSTSVKAWGQPDNTSPKELEKPFLQPYSPENNKSSLDSSLKEINNNNDKNKTRGQTRNKALITSPKKTPHSFTRKSAQTGNQAPGNLKAGTPGSSVSFQGYNQYPPAASGSFLDGYLLKSLQEKRMVRKQVENDNSSDETMLKKKKGSFKK